MRRMWTGIAAGLLAAMVVVGVAVGAYRAGQRHDLVVRTTEGGEVVRVVDRPGWGYGHGPGPGVLLFPLLGIALVVLLVRGGRWGGGWHPYGGVPWGPGGPDPRLDDWHRRAHATPGPGDHPSPPPAASRKEGWR